MSPRTSPAALPGSPCRALPHNRTFALALASVYKDFFLSLCTSGTFSSFRSWLVCLFLRWTTIESPKSQPLPSQTFPTSAVCFFQYLADALVSSSVCACRPPEVGTPGAEGLSTALISASCSARHNGGVRACLGEKKKNLRWEKRRTGITSLYRETEARHGPSGPRAVTQFPRSHWGCMVIGRGSLPARLMQRC